MDKSMVWCGLDFDAEGKDSDFLRIPHSVDTSAYGWIGVPVVRIKNGEGPTALLCAGNHGDEYEGQVALNRLARAIDAADVTGRVIILPPLNAPAVRAGRRVSPLDEGNLNRAFPGRAAGTPTEMLAHYISTELFARADLVIDLHSGGRSLNYVHCGLGHYGKAPETDAAIRKLLEVFSAPWSILTQGGGGGGATTLYAAAAERGIPAITCELGGGATLDPEGTRHAEEGTRRVLAAYGIWQGADVPPRAETRFARTLPRDLSIYARHAGLFEPHAAPGDAVSKGQSAGLLYHIDQVLTPPTELRFAAEGIVSCRRALTLAGLGDCLFNLAETI
ncbi:succinylglutamate desuccinylase/aspartoacylase family protein [Pararhodobacter zhoushanensis]|uniref:succinylglutamate desuccinylase/aspartoacylase family protein n=1 Tax=Pararhodobacter zhoushanensis TaxID=2479545 RepID=UPI000F8CA0AE|nr:succinylglutamate desuccinylase/aspartoacylase family protein [Pararhodobacter zhoushanensis]